MPMTNEEISRLDPNFKKLEPAQASIAEGQTWQERGPVSYVVPHTVTVVHVGQHFVIAAGCIDHPSLGRKVFAWTMAEFTRAFALAHP